MKRLDKLAAGALVSAAMAIGASAAYGGHPTPDPPILIADATKQPFIDIYLAAHPGQAMHVSEVDGEKARQLAAVELDPGGHRVLPRLERWRCDRRSRRFVAAVSPGGPPVATFGVRTASCARRLSASLTRRARPGSAVRLAVRDRWGIGDLRLRFCVDPPTAPRRCRGLRLARDKTRATARFRVGARGRWRTALHGPGIRIPDEISVGEPPRRNAGPPAPPKVLLAGDSMMQGLDGFLSDRLGKRATVFRDVVPNSGISKPGINWLRRAADRGRRVRPDATVIFLGANEGFDMTTPSGETYPCCTIAWFIEYRRRVRQMMRSYGRGGRGKVFWLAMPQVRFPQRHALQLLVNTEIRRAANGMPGVRVLRLDELFTPGGRYRDVMAYGGRRVRVREVDGIHLTLAGAQIAAGKVFSALRSAGVVR